MPYVARPLRANRHERRRKMQLTRIVDLSLNERAERGRHGFDRDTYSSSVVRLHDVSEHAEAAREDLRSRAASFCELLIILAGRSYSGQELMRSRARSRRARLR